MGIRYFGRPCGAMASPRWSSWITRYVFSCGSWNTIRRSFCRLAIQYSEFHAIVLGQNTGVRHLVIIADRKQHL
jgi:hypothetical protein